MGWDERRRRLFRHVVRFIPSDWSRHCPRVLQFLIKLFSVYASMRRCAMCIKLKFTRCQLFFCLHLLPNWTVTGGRHWSCVLAVAPFRQRRQNHLNAFRWRRATTKLQRSFLLFLFSTLHFLVNSFISWSSFPNLSPWLRDFSFHSMLLAMCIRCCCWGSKCVRERLLNICCSHIEGRANHLSSSRFLGRQQEKKRRERINSLSPPSSL